MLARTSFSRASVYLPTLLGQLVPSSHVLQTKSGVSSTAKAGQLAPGDVFTLTKTFTPAEVSSFLQLSGDSNPIHSQAEAAKAAGLPGPILPGMLSASLFPAIIGSCFPGAVYLSQTLKFRSPALLDEVHSLLGSLTLQAAKISRPTLHRGAAPDPTDRSICHVGDSLNATLTVDRAGSSGGSSRVSFLTQCHRAGSGELVVEGTALALIPKQAQHAAAAQGRA